MDEHQHIAAYIRQQQAAGMDRQAIRAALLQKGLSEVAIGDAFVEATLDPGPPHMHQDRPQSEPPIGLKYRFATAMGQTGDALLVNLPALGWSLVFGALLFAAAGYAALQLIALVPDLAASGQVSPAVYAPVLGLPILIWTICSAAAIAWYVSVVAILVNAGAGGSKLGFKEAVGRSLQHWGRASLATGLIIAMSIWPFCIVSFVGVALFAWAFAGYEIAIILFWSSLLLVLLSFIWSYLSVAIYGLAPLITVFESASPLAALKRSRHLLGKGGRSIIITGLILTSIASYFVAWASASASDSYGSTNIAPAIIGAVLTLVAYTFFIGMLVLLYRNRRALHG